MPWDPPRKPGVISHLKILNFLSSAKPLCHVRPHAHRSWVLSCGPPWGIPFLACQRPCTQLVLKGLRVTSTGCVPGRPGDTSWGRQVVVFLISGEREAQ